LEEGDCTTKGVVADGPANSGRSGGTGRASATGGGETGAAASFLSATSPPLGGDLGGDLDVIREDMPTGKSMDEHKTRTRQLPE
jgi:hypothetical protein